MDYRILNRYRKKHKITWGELAKLVGMNAVTLRLIGIGSIKKPQPKNAAILKEFIEYHAGDVK